MITMPVIRSGGIAAAVFFTLLVAALPARSDAIDDDVRSAMDRQHIPGVTLAVIKDGRPVKVKGYGVANIELNTPMTPNTVLKIASVSKQFVAIGALMLVDDGKLSLDDPIANFLDNPPESWRAITIRQTMSHTGGLTREAPGYDNLKVQDDTDVIKSAYVVPLLSKPGEKWSYSNLDYFVLAEVIRKVSGMPWPDFLAARIFKPLGMNATRTTSMTDVVPNRADGYLYRDNSFTRAETILALRPSGSLLSSAADLVRWDAALDGGRMLRESLLTQMWTPTKLSDGSTTNYGFGWVIDSYSGHRRVRHGGSLPGFRSEYVRFVDDGINVIVLANSDGARPDSIAVAIAGHYIPGLWPKRRAIKLDPSVLTEYAGRYQLDPTTIATVAVDGEALSVQFSSGGAQWRMVPDSANSFFIVEDERYVFTRVAHQGMHLAIRVGNAEIAKADRLP
jgi:D-alanyl-D-alanine carboxypeptidase